MKILVSVGAGAISKKKIKCLRIKNLGYGQWLSAEEEEEEEEEFQSPPTISAVSSVLSMIQLLSSCVNSS